MDLFLNEHSLETAIDRYAANKWFEILGKLYQVAKVKEFKEIKVPIIFFGHAFASNYTFYQWADDRDFDSDLRTLLKSVITTTPVIEDMLEAKSIDVEKVFECLYNEEPAIGLGAASEHVFDSVAVSFSAQADWGKAYIPVMMTLLDSDAIQEYTCNVRHCSEEKHFMEHLGWLMARQRLFIPSGSILWLKRNTIFPNLIFCNHVQAQVAAYRGTDPSFIQLQKRLFELEAYAAIRGGGIFDAGCMPSKVTPESESRKREFKDELNRLCPDGEIRMFDWHSRFTPGAGRIHFYPLENTNKIIVGNIANQNEIK